MAFINLAPQLLSPITPAQLWAKAVQGRSAQTILELVSTTRDTYGGLWQDEDTTPQGPIDRIAALGIGAAAAFQAHAASVNYLLTVLPLFDGTADLIAEAKNWQIPEGWIIAFNADGSATAKPPSA